MNPDPFPILHMKLEPIIFETLIFSGTSLLCSLRRILYVKTCLSESPVKNEDIRFEMQLQEMMFPSPISPCA